MVTVKEPLHIVRDRYLVIVDDTYQPTKKNPPTSLDLIQDSSNCRLVGSGNNGYAQTKIKVSVDELNKFAKQYRLNTNKGNEGYFGMALFCEYNKDKNLIIGKLDVKKYPKKFAELIKNNYTFGIMRYDHTALHLDIKDNDIVNKVHTIPKGGRTYHWTNIRFNKMFMEDGTYKAESIYDKFGYDYKTFRTLIENGFIDKYFYFIDYR